MLKGRIEKARTLVEALPYIRRFHGATIVIKYGGSVMVEPRLGELFAADVALLKFVGMNPVIVHGGGAEISKWMKRVGKEAVFVDGLRFTDAETMEITEMVLSGKVNREVVGRINRAGGRAVGLSGKDAGLFTGRKIQGADDRDLGRVGEIERTDPDLLMTLAREGYVPVISSVGTCEEGESLNMNADHVAAEIAAALGARKLIYLTDVDGFMREGALIERLSVDEAEAALGSPEIGGGMLPKLRSAVEAVRGGVRRAHIINGTVEHAVLLELLTDHGIGTMIEA